MTLETVLREQPTNASSSKVRFRSAQNFPDVGYAPVLLGEVDISQSLDVRKARVSGRWRVSLVFSGKQAGREWKIRKESQTIGLHDGQEIAFDIAREQAEFVLAADKGVETGTPCRPLRFHDLPGGKIGAARVADLSCLIKSSNARESPRSGSRGPDGEFDIDQSNRSSVALG